MLRKAFSRSTLPKKKPGRNEFKSVSRDAAATPELSAQENQLLSMLGSSDLNTVRNAGKRIYRSRKLNAAVYDATEKKILRLLPRAGKGRLQSDTIAWLCKALIISEDRKYIQTLNKVVKSNGSASLRGHAQKAREKLSPSKTDGSFDSI